MEGGHHVPTAAVDAFELAVLLKLMVDAPAGPTTLPRSISRSRGARDPGSDRAPDRGSVLEIGRDLAAVLLELLDDLLVQPDVHRGRVVLVAGVVQLVGQLLAGVQARIQIEQLHQIDDRGAPVQLLRVLRGQVVEHGLDIDRSTRGRAAAGGGGGRGGAAAGGRLGLGLGGLRRRRVRLGGLRLRRAERMEDLADDAADEAHGVRFPVAVARPDRPLRLS